MDIVARGTNIPRTALRKAIEKGAALLDKEIPAWWTEIDVSKLGFWRDSQTPLELVFGNENAGRGILFGHPYQSPNLSAEQAVNLENHGFMLYQSPYTMWQLATEWVKYIQERKGQNETTSSTLTASGE